jgi:lysophospholipase L1-like esterase
MVQPVVASTPIGISGNCLRSKDLLQKVILAIAASVAAALLVLAGVKLYVAALGIRDSSFVYENQLDMWRPEPTIGFVNRLGFSGYCFGTVLVETNERGFRGGRPVTDATSPGVTRLIGVGDSVTWGTCVQEHEAFLAVLSEMLRPEMPVEVINAGVVGYSSYQEALFLERYVLPLAPDIVLVNFCINDFLPTEDPFGNIRGIYARYLKQLSAGESANLKDGEAAALGAFVAVLEGGEPIWSAMEGLLRAHPSLAIRVFIGIPLLRMAQLCRSAGARLVVLLIPPREQDAIYHGVIEYLQQLLREGGVEVIDFTSLFPREPSSQSAAFSEAAPHPSQGQRFNDLQKISLVRRITQAQRSQFFIDSWHPTVRGNRIIAERIREYLLEEPRQP